MKHWRVNELEFINKWKANLEKLLSMVHTTHLILISNVQKMRRHLNRHLNITLDAEVNNERKLHSRKKNAKKTKNEKEG